MVNKAIEHHMEAPFVCHVSCVFPAPLQHATSCCRNPVCTWPHCRTCVKDYVACKYQGAKTSKDGLPNGTLQQGKHYDRLKSRQTSSRSGLEDASEYQACAVTLQVPLDR